MRRKLLFLIFLLTQSGALAECTSAGRTLIAPLVPWHDFYYIDQWNAAGSLHIQRCIDLILTNLSASTDVTVTVDAADSEWGAMSAASTNPNNSLNFPMSLVRNGVSSPVPGTHPTLQDTVTVTDYKRLTYCADYATSQTLASAAGVPSPPSPPMDLHLTGALKFTIHVCSDRGAMLGSFYSHMELLCPSGCNAANFVYNGSPVPPSTAFPAGIPGDPGQAGLSAQRNSIEVPAINGGRPF